MRCTLQRTVDIGTFGLHVPCQAPSTTDLYVPFSIVIGEPGRWEIDEQILEHSREGVEAYLKMGQSLGRAL